MSLIYKYVDLLLRDSVFLLVYLLEHFIMTSQ